MKGDTLQVHLDHETIMKINKARGLVKVSTYIRAVLEQHFEENPDGRLRMEAVA